MTMPVNPAEVKLSIKQIDMLAAAVAGQPSMPRTATKEKAITRFNAVLDRELGTNRALATYQGILLADDLNEASKRLEAAIKGAPMEDQTQTETPAEEQAQITTNPENREEPAETAETAAEEAKKPGTRGKPNSLAGKRFTLVDADFRVGKESDRAKFTDAVRKEPGITYEKLIEKGIKPAAIANDMKNKANRYKVE